MNSYNNSHEDSTYLNLPLSFKRDTSSSNASAISESSSPSINKPQSLNRIPSFTRPPSVNNEISTKWANLADDLPRERRHTYSSFTRSNDVTSTLTLKNSKKSSQFSDLVSQRLSPQPHSPLPYIYGCLFTFCTKLFI